MRLCTHIRALAAMLASAIVAGCGGAQTTSDAPPAPPAPARPAAASEPATAGTNAAEPAQPAAITKRSFGTVDGKQVGLYELTNAHGLVMKVTNYGTIVTELHVPDRSGQLGDIVAGYDNLDGYLESTPYFGATIGRVANRIVKGRFKLGGKTYQLATNDGPYHLHGGKKGWDKVVWDVVAAEDTPQGPTISFTYVSPDGEEGYPGNVTASVTYALTNDDELRVEMRATTDRTTLVNMAHHSYWNLGGYASGSIADHELTLHAAQYTPGNPFVPNGVIKPVKGTAFDFTTPKPIGQDLSAVVVKGNPPGYDHNFVVNGDPHALRPVARVKDPKSGRVMTLEGNQPGVMFYAGILLDGTITGKGHTYRQYEALCLETQAFPNSINVPAWQREVILEPGQSYHHVMIHRFSTE